jgi:hypothetical protein
MNNAIVICYVGRAIEPEAVNAIQQIITSTCSAMPELMTIKAFDEDSIAKALLRRAADDTKISFLEGGENAEAAANKILEEARTKAIQLIKSKYNGMLGHIALSRDIAMAKYHQRVNAIDDDELNLLNAIDVIVDIPQKRLNTLLSKTVRETIFAMKDM